MLVPIFIGSLVGFALSTWVRAQMGIWSLFPVAILKKLFPGEEGHKVPGYDRIISWHALFACVWMFVCMLQLASAVSTACWARRIHRFAGKFVGPTSLIAMTPLWVLAMWKNTDYQGEVKVLAYMIVSFESALILVNVYCGLRCILDPKNKISAKSKSEAIEKHKAYMFFAILWSMAPGYDRFCMACVQMLHPQCFTGFKGVAIGAFVSNVQLAAGMLVIPRLVGIQSAKLVRHNVFWAHIHIALMVFVMVASTDGKAQVCLGWA